VFGWGGVFRSRGSTYTINLTGAEFAQIPEPSTYVLAGFGLAAVWLVRRKKASAAAR
jgi:hypothetical protein